MDINKMSFNKRVRLVKKEVFDVVTKSNELGKIKSNSGSKTETGYYSLRTIFDALHPALDKYGVDVEPMFNKDNVVFTWYDDESDAKRETMVDFSNLVGLAKLPMMANIVQSEGGVKSYLRRYGYTILFNLNSTDIIEKYQPKDQSKKQPQQRQQPTQPKPQAPKQPTTPPRKINNNQLKMYYALVKEKGFTTEEDKKLIDSLVKEGFKLDSKTNWLEHDFHKFIDFMKKSDKETITFSLERKIQKRRETEGAK
jgi:hypothetical protein